MDEGEKGLYIFHSELKKKAIKEIRDKKATGNDDGPEDGLKFLEEDVFKIMT